MTFLIDENFPRSAAEVLSAAGHETLFVISLRQPNRANILARLKWFVENIPFPIDNKAFAIRDKTYCRR